MQYFGRYFVGLKRTDWLITCMELTDKASIKLENKDFASCKKPEV